MKRNSVLTLTQPLAGPYPPTKTIPKRGLGVKLKFFTWEMRGEKERYMIDRELGFRQRQKKISTYSI